MKKIITVAIALLTLLGLQGAHAGGINDNATGGYWGADGHGRGDIIGSSLYDISGATIMRAANVLTITITTNFAGHAGVEPGLAAGGIGYGDVFLAKTWNPFGTDLHHTLDKASNGTLWSYGLSLDNRISKTGGSFEVYKLNGATNADNIANSESFINCGSSCIFRDGQATAVKTSSSTVVDTKISGTWSVVADEKLKFEFDMSSSNDLLSFKSFAMHWGETCQNDVIEGATSVVSAPGSIPLVALGLGAMLLLRRRQAGIAALS